MTLFGPIEVRRTFDTAAAPLAVWSALEAAPRWPEVLHDLAEGRIEPDGVLAAGARMVTRARPGSAAVDMSYRVLEAEPPRRLVIAAETAEFQSRTEYAIEASSDGGARLTVTAQARPVRWLHCVTTTFARTPYAQFFSSALDTRSRAMLALAERIAAERRSSAVSSLRPPS